MQGSILVVEHNAASQSLMAGNFRHAGYRVYCARDFSEAEALVRKTRPDVALLDWIPGAPGLAFARQLRSDHRTAETSIIMLGLSSDDQDAVAALESGADDYVTKPFSMRELLARVKAVVRRRAPQLTDQVVELSGLRLDPAALRVTAEGREIELRRTEFKLLHFFMTRPQLTLTRRTLLDKVWGDHVFVEERTVDVHVRRLRRALGPSHGPLIETVRGLGYRFQAEPESEKPSLYSVVAGLASVRSLDAVSPAPHVNVA